MLHEELLLLLFKPVEASAILEMEQIEPVLCDFVVVLPMNVIRFMTISSIEKESIRANAFRH